MTPDAILRTVVEAYRDCGSSAYLDTLVAMAGLAMGAVAVAAAFSPGAAKRNPLAIAAFVVGDLALVGGFAGYFLGLTHMEAALAMVDPAMRTTIEAVGRHEAQMCIWIGGSLWVPITLLAGAALAGASMATQGAPPKEPPA